MTTEQLVSAIYNLAVLKVSLTAMALGGLGGVAHGWTESAPAEDEPPNLSLPKQTVLGAVSAVATMYVTNPTTALGFIGGAIAAGFAAQALLKALAAKAVAAVAQRELRAARRGEREALALLEARSSSKGGGS